MLMKASWMTVPEGLSTVRERVSLRKTSSNGNTRFRTDEIYETLIELVEVSGLAKAFLHNRLGNRQAI
jgi:hypothetical protein